MRKVLLSFVLLLTLLMAGVRNSFAQYPTSKIPDSWVRQEGDAKAETNGFKFELYKDTKTNELCAAVESYDGPATETAKIPEKVSYNGKKYIVRGVVGIWGTRKFKNLKLPSTLRFYFQTVGFGSSVLETVDFGKNSELKTLGKMAFMNCPNLKWITVPTSVDSIGELAFYGCKSMVIAALPLLVKHIGANAFAGCTSLREVKWWGLEPKGGLSQEELGALYKNVEERTFEGCSSLTSFTFPPISQVEFRRVNIGKCAFWNCANLQNVNVGHSVIGRVEDSAFSNCKDLRTLKGDFEWMKDKNVAIDNYIGEYAFHNCEKINHIYFASVDSICKSAFWGCNSLTEVSLSDCTYIGEHAFGNCKSLKNVHLSKDLKVFDAFAFFGCDALEHIYGLNEDMDFVNGLYLPNYKKLFGVQAIMISYKYFAKDYIRKRIKEWQTKKEYETTADYLKRVNTQTRDAKMKQLLDSARVAYIKERQPKPIRCQIDGYDADAGVYKLRILNMNQYYGYYDFNDANAQIIQAGDVPYVFAKVPPAAAPAFKENFKDVKIEPTYCIAKNYLSVASCKFTLNGKTYESPTLYDDETAQVTLDLPPLEIDLGGGQRNSTAQNKPQTPVDNTIDQNIPATTVQNKNTFAVIIGNEKYSQVAAVPFAENDAKVFAEYCRKTLGLPKENVRTYGNATYAGFVQAVNDIRSIAQAYSGDINVIFYYAGHGIPSEQSKDAYLLPVDADGRQIDVCYSVGKLYKELGALGAKSVVVFMDACFSGAQRGEGMLASARGVALKAKAEAPQGNMVVFTAATGDETAYPYKEKGHGMFTYFLLKKLRDTKGECTLQQLGEFILSSVKKQSVVTNRKSQTPTVVPSVGVADSWRTMKLK